MVGIGQSRIPAWRRAPLELLNLILALALVEVVKYIPRVVVARGGYVADHPEPVDSEKVSLALLCALPVLDACNSRPAGLLV